MFNPLKHTIQSLVNPFWASTEGESEVGSFSGSFGVPNNDISISSSVDKSVAVISSSVADDGVAAVGLAYGNNEATAVGTASSAEVTDKTVGVESGGMGYSATAKVLCISLPITVLSQYYHSTIKITALHITQGNL